LRSCKLVVIDIDGTLLIRADEISSRNKAALAELHRRGIAVSLCSGRAIQAARTVLEQLELDGFHIFFDGALVINPHTGVNVYMKTIGPDLVGRAVDFVHRHGIILDLFTATEYYAERESWVTALRRDYFKIAPTIVDFSVLPQNDPVIKGTLVVRSAQEKAGADRFRQYFGGELHLSLTKTPAYANVDFINVIAPGVSKRTALEALVRHMNITLDEVMAIGDGPNDIPVLSAVGLAVAMGNAPPAVRAAARYVTGDVDHDGVAEAIEGFLLT
jgi:Cof subfamily protein (haloacid dehalogenase superfamily)